MIIPRDKELILDFVDPYNLRIKKLRIHLELFSHFNEKFRKKFELADFDTYWTLVQQWDIAMRRLGRAQLW